MYMATVCDAAQRGRVVTIDTTPRARMPEHPRIAYVRGSSIDPATVDRVRSGIAPGERVMVVLDSLHNREHVLAELRAWAPLVSVGCSLIVEDTNINGHPVHTDFAPDRGPGPFEAVRDYLATTDAFEVDRDREKFMMTFNPGGYLRRVR
jgi:cephalosporin hydroxylase